MVFISHSHIIDPIAADPTILDPDCGGIKACRGMELAIARMLARYGYLSDIVHVGHLGYLFSPIMIEV